MVLLSVVVLKTNKTTTLVDSKKLAQAEELFSMLDSKLAFVGQVMAAEEGDATCNGMSQAAWTACQTANGAYLHGALNFFNNTLCMLNKGFTSEVESALCHFSKSMAMNPDKSTSQTITKTFGGKTVALSIAPPTEAFAIAAGYDAKATVAINGTNFMILYWGGTDKSSKGFLIQGASGFAIGEKHPSYIEWSRTDATNQYVKVFVGSFTTTYLATVGTGSKDNPKGGDRAMFGKATYNSTTKATTAQVVLIEGQRGAGTATTPACYRMFASGTKDDTVTVAKTDNAHSSTGHAVTSTFKDKTDMDAFSEKDSKTLANGTGNLGAGLFGTLVIAFDKSCNDVNGAASAGKPFASSDVNFTAVVADIF